MSYPLAGDLLDPGIEPAICISDVRSLNQEDPLEEEMATCSGILAWKIPWIEEPGRLQPMGSQELDTI